jgi:hypothetical protein
MKRVLLIAAILSLALIAPAAAQQCQPFSGAYGNTTLTGNGYAKYLPTTVKRVTDTPTDGVVIHKLASGATMWVSGANIRFRTDGVNPTSTSGTLVIAPAVVKWTPDDIKQLREIRFIQVTSGAEVDFNYCW